jgi:hypothetical protein
MTNRADYSIKDRLSAAPAFPRMMWWLYFLMLLAAWIVEIRAGVETYKYTVDYRSYCVNPLLEYWVRWFAGVLQMGILFLPGAVWSAFHRREWKGIAVLIVCILYLLITLVMLIAGLEFGTVPHFFFYLDNIYG